MLYLTITNYDSNSILLPDFKNSASAPVVQLVWTSSIIACGHEVESRLKWNFPDFPHHLWLLLSDYRGMAKWFGAHRFHNITSFPNGCLSSPKFVHFCSFFKIVPRGRPPSRTGSHLYQQECLVSQQPPKCAKIWQFLMGLAFSKSLVFYDPPQKFSLEFIAT